VHNFLEIISSSEGQLAYIVDGNWSPERTLFLTPDDFGQQMGMIVYKKNQEIPAHIHLPITRTVEGTTECVIVRSGECEIDIFDSNRQKIVTRHLKTGDIVLLLKGGHGFRMLEDTVLFEVKQGPYVGNADKERF
jgi:cupin fold WbuC family metalloprotein